MGPGLPLEEIDADPFNPFGVSLHAAMGLLALLLLVLGYIRA